MAHLVAPHISAQDVRIFLFARALASPFCGAEVVVCGQTNASAGWTIRLLCYRRFRADLAGGTLRGATNGDDIRIGGPRDATPAPMEIWNAAHRNRPDAPGGIDYDRHIDSERGRRFADQRLDFRRAAIRIAASERRTQARRTARKATRDREVSARRGSQYSSGRGEQSSGHRQGKSSVGARNSRRRHSATAELFSRPASLVVATGSESSKTRAVPTSHRAIEVAAFPSIAQPRHVPIAFSF